MVEKDDAPKSATGSINRRGLKPGESVRLTLPPMVGPRLDPPEPDEITLAPPPRQKGEPPPAYGEEQAQVEEQEEREEQPARPRRAASHRRHSSPHKDE